MSDTGIYILLLIFELRISYAQSLKDKRRVVKSIKDRLAARFNISIAELGELDNYRQSVIGLTMISNDNLYLEKQASAIEALMLEVKNIELLTVSKEWL